MLYTKHFLREARWSTRRVPSLQSLYSTRYIKFAAATPLGLHLSIWLLRKPPNLPLEPLPAAEGVWEQAKRMELELRVFCTLSRLQIAAILARCVARRAAAMTDRGEGTCPYWLLAGHDGVCVLDWAGATFCIVFFRTVSGSSVVLCYGMEHMCNWVFLFPRRHKRTATYLYIQQRARQVYIILHFS